MVHDDDGDGGESANDDDDETHFSKSILLCIVVLCGRTCVLVTPYSPAQSVSFSVSAQAGFAAFRTDPLRAADRSSSSAS